MVDPLLDPVPPSHVDAKRLLEAAGQVVLEVIGVYPDSILYVSGGRRAMTAWLRSTKDGVKAQCQYGFTVEPPALWFDGDE